MLQAPINFPWALLLTTCNGFVFQRIIYALLPILLLGLILWQNVVCVDDNNDSLKSFASWISLKDNSLILVWVSFEIEQAWAFIRFLYE